MTFVALELGGHPTDPRNLRPERLEEAHRKEVQGYALNRAVCTNRMLLTTAQERIRDPRTWR